MGGSKRDRPPSRAVPPWPSGTPWRVFSRPRSPPDRRHSGPPNPGRPPPSRQGRSVTPITDWLWAPRMSPAELTDPSKQRVVQSGMAGPVRGPSPGAGMRASHPSASPAHASSPLDCRPRARCDLRVHSHVGAARARTALSLATAHQGHLRSWCSSCPPSATRPSSTENANCCFSEISCILFSPAGHRATGRNAGLASDR
jgi:hypothetical protein